MMRGGEVGLEEMPILVTPRVGTLHEEILVVEEPDTVLDPRTVMVHLEDAAEGAMRGGG